MPAARSSDLVLDSKMVEGECCECQRLRVWLLGYSQGFQVLWDEACVQVRCDEGWVHCKALQKACIGAEAPNLKSCHINHLWCVLALVAVQ